MVPSGSFEAVASKLTSSGASPDVGVAVKIASGAWFPPPGPEGSTMNPFATPSVSPKPPSLNRELIMGDYQDFKITVFNLLGALTHNLTGQGARRGLF